MIELPDFSIPFDHENNFYLTCKPNRISKALAHYELYKKSLGLPGEIVECGVFKGVSLVRWAMFRELFEHARARKIIGFDTFGAFPEAGYEGDKEKLTNWLANAGNQSISRDQLYGVLDKKGIKEGIELVEGNILETLEAYLEKNPHLRISLLNLDTDIYEPAAAVLEALYPRIVPGGVLVLDDYGVFAGENMAVDEYFKGKNAVFEKFPFAMTPAFLVKEGS